MRKTLMILVLVVFTGCVQAEVQEMPSFTTKQGKDNARQCQMAYSACVSAFRQEVGGIPGIYQREKALDNCNQILEDCYKTCE